MNRSTASLLSMIFITSCNLPKWNQNRLDKKFARKDVKKEMVQLGETKLNFFHGGQGDPVLLIHGFGGDAQITWQKSILDLSKDHYVIAPDLVWFGKSESTKKANLETQVQSMYALLDYLKVQKVSVAGISYGGFVALGMTYLKRDRIKKLCIVDSPGTTFDLKHLDVLCQQQGVNDVTDIFVCQSAEDVQELSDLGMHKSKKLPKGILNDTYDLYFSRHHNQLKALLNTLPEEKTKFTSLSIDGFPKSAVIWGEYDKVFPLSQGEEFAKFLKAKMYIIPKAGHAPNIDNFKGFQKALRDFLRN